MTDLNVTGNLTVLQGALFRENVFVASAAALGPTAVQAALTVAGATSFANTLQVDGTSDVTRVDAPSHAVLEDLTATQSLSTGALQVQGATTAGGLNVEGALTSAGPVRFAGAVNVSGAPLALSVGATAPCVSLGSASTTGAMTVAAATVTADMTVTTAMASNGVFSALLADVDGEASTAKDVSVSQSCAVLGQLSVSGTLDITGDIGVGDEARASEALRLGGHLVLAQGAGGAPPPTISAATVFDSDAAIDLDAIVTVSGNDSSGTVRISNTAGGTKTAWRLTTITVQFGTPFAAAPFVVLTPQQASVAAGQGWGAANTPVQLWVTDVSAAAFTIFVAELGATYTSGTPASIHFFAIASA